MLDGFSVKGTEPTRSAANPIAYSTEKHSDSKFPVLPVVLSACLSTLVVILILAIIYVVIWRRRQDKKYGHYREITNTSVKPPTFTTQKIQTQHLHPGSYGIRPAKHFSSEESVSPLSSEHEDTFYDALDKFGSRSSSIRSMSSREASPSSPYEDEEEDEEVEYGENHLGRVWFSLEYDKKGESLSVCIVKARNLSTRGRAAKANDPFIKLQILPKRKRISHDHQTTHKWKTNRPDYNETFCFHMPLTELERSSLQLTVYNGYRASEQCTIGQISFPLSEMDADGKMELWRDLAEPIEDSADGGQIHISLSYYPTLDRLTIIVLRAVNLRKMDSHGTDAFVKVSFSIGNKIRKTKRTSIHEHTRDPLFNEAFNFTATEDDLGTSTLLVSVMHSRGEGEEDKLIGRVLLGGMMYARGKECEHWTEMMTHPRQMIKYWHSVGN